MPGSDLAGILPVVAKVLGRHDPVLVAEQAIGGHLRGVKLHLDFHILRDRDRAARELLHEHLPRLAGAVDIGVNTIAVIGDLFHLRVLQVAFAEAEHREERAAGRLLLDQVHERLVAGHTHVQVAVGGEDHPVHTAGDEPFRRLLVGHVDTGAAMRGAARRECLDYRENLSLLIAAGGGQLHTCVTGIGDDRHRVVFRELLDQHREGLLHQRQLVRGAHRARHVDEKHEVPGGPLAAVDVATLEADANQTPAGVPGTLGRLERHRERPVADGLRVVVAEVVYHLLDPYGIRGRQPAGGEKPAHIGIRRRIDVDRKRGERMLRRCPRPVLVKPGIPLAGLCILLLSLPPDRLHFEFPGISVAGRPAGSGNRCGSPLHSIRLTGTHTVGCHHRRRRGRHRSPPRSPQSIFRLVDLLRG